MKFGEVLACLRNFAPCKSIQHKKENKKQQQSDENIKILLECEKRAKEIINKAQERRKDCKLRANKVVEKEMDGLQKEREANFKAFCAKHDKENEKMKTEIDADIDKKMCQIDEQVTKNKGKVIKMLMDELVNIQPKAHRNLNFNKASKPASVQFKSPQKQSIRIQSTQSSESS